MATKKAVAVAVRVLFRMFIAYLLVFLMDGNTVAGDVALSTYYQAPAQRNAS